MAETVNHPAHYGGDTTYEVIKVLEAWRVLDFCCGNAVKYIARAGRKDPAAEIEDLRKAEWYIHRRIEQLSGERPSSPAPEPGPAEITEVEDLDTEPVERDIELEYLRSEVQHLRDVVRDNYWIYQGDGEDHLESLTCPVVITAAQLMRILDERR